ncbi:MAG: DNA polymerase III subunit gamma/tau, partial [Anaerolineales bacterium]
MATQALYNRWRGQVFADILGQDHITKTLQNQIRAGRVGHAYLFAGMRGTGKTSTARIMAKAVNCVGETDAPPCDHCHICRSIAEGRSLDLIEIDGASNRGIDEIRQLRDSVSFSPSEGRYKIYVIDEVHMLTNEAFNALLKTLEEPPPHVIFILCTTAPHRLPDTVLSRCQRFDFRRAPLPLLLKKLHMICDQEKIAIERDALEFIARRATGSFRDAESLLDQLSSYSDGLEEITLEQVRSILGSVSSALVTQLVLSMTAGDLPAGLRTINQAIDTGAEPRQFLKEIIDHLRALLLVKVGGRDDRHALSAQALAEIGQLAEAGSF